MRRIDLTGKKFGRLTVIEVADSSKGKLRWRCKCDCGKEIVVYGTSLKSGNTKSCGCFRTENAKKLYSGVRQNDKHLYAVWNGIKQRCRNSNSKSFPNYGGRGIDICNEWANNYETFYYWAMQAGYKRGLEIDRIDNEDNYEPKNCRWVDREVQANNKRNNTLYTINGITKTLPQWCRKYNQDYFMVRQRICKLGWSVENALKTPKKGKQHKEKR